MRANDQRQIIEQLLGITILSEKADALKEQIKRTKDLIAEEKIRIKAVQEANERILQQIDNLKKRKALWIAKQQEDCTRLERGLRDLAEVDIDTEIASQKLLTDYHDRKKKKADAEKWIKSIQQDQAKEEKTAAKLEKEISDLENHTCYACGGALHDQKHEEVLASKRKQRQECALQLLALSTQEQEHLEVISEVGEIGDMPRVIYDTLEEALNHRNSLEQLLDQLVKRQDETDPYTDQIADMETTALADITWDAINALTQIQEHQEFLLKMLTNKDSFVRKKIIDQNLAYLNNRLGNYLSAIGLPHEVKFQNDLSVEITELGRDLDFDNLSRGERNRLILSLSWAFRDVWESLYQHINLLFIDELIDSGMDASGVENSLGILKRMSRERNKSVFLVSHRDELSGRVNNILTVTKENGFTSYGSDVEQV
jgi:energy-coupling factor transporter ATP-binding protein EcfA2